MGVAFLILAVALLAYGVAANVGLDRWRRSLEAQGRDMMAQMCGEFAADHARCAAMVAGLMKENRR